MADIRIKCKECITCAMGIEDWNYARLCVCDELDLDFESSRGLGPRPYWTSTWTVKDPKRVRRQFIWRRALCSRGVPCVLRASLRRPACHHPASSSPAKYPFCPSGPHFVPGRLVAGPSRTLPVPGHPVSTFRVRFDAGVRRACHRGIIRGEGFFARGFEEA